VKILTAPFASSLFSRFQFQNLFADFGEYFGAILRRAADTQLTMFNLTGTIAVGSGFGPGIAVEPNPKAGSVL
jgi:hypothetical protein